MSKMTITFSGLEVIPTTPSSMQVIVQPGWLKHEKRVVSVLEPCPLNIRPAGKKQFAGQVYRLQGEGTSSPCGWNGESMRGSGGAPYQRMVPGSLVVRSKDRNTLYRSETDYVEDNYWGTIKRHPLGRIRENEELFIDYSVWLCRYDAVVLSMDGSLKIVEGDSEALESRELLLPEPPVIHSGFVLAHIFTGWGQSCIHGGGSYIVPTVTEQPIGATGSPVPFLSGRYEDMVQREYVIEITANSVLEEYDVRMAATGEDYGTSRNLSIEALRWTGRKELSDKKKLPLLLKSAYGHEIDWGLELDLSQSLNNKADFIRQIYRVHAIPEMIFDMRPCLDGFNPLEIIPVEQKKHLLRIKQLAVSGTSTRIAFFGESTTRAGRWPYQFMNGLRKMYPHTTFYSSNVAIGGEGSQSGILRLENEVLSLEPDLVIMEYLVNDACSGDPEGVERTIRWILERIASDGVSCLILTNNGMNPVFSAYGAKRNYQSYHDLYQKLAAEYQVAFVGGYTYFSQLHQFGKYFITELKGNMVNHPFGNEDIHWCPFDTVLSKAVLSCFEVEKQI